jgi:hypothetical protein
MAVRFGCGPSGIVTPFRISVITYVGDRGYHSIDAYIGHLRQFFARIRPSRAMFDASHADTVAELQH